MSVVSEARGGLPWSCNASVRVSTPSFGNFSRAYTHLRAQSHGEVSQRLVVERLAENQRAFQPIDEHKVVLYKGTYNITIDFIHSPHAFRFFCSLALGVDKHLISCIHFGERSY